ncbi:MAG: SDR family NAD(P)-dependent oxidoreductase [Clostridia bacterium]|nr:SDR family NAD(P)-dependent oxidoreductase [Clostridia bacterium]
MKNVNDAKIVVITGATSGIGLATAEYLIEKGYKVYGIARRAFEGNFKCFCADVCDYPKIDEILSGILALEGKIDVFINNAGFGIAGAMNETSPESVQKIADVNLTALCVLSGKAVNAMKSGGGKIINVSSVGGIMPLPYQAMYSATKAGVEVFSRALANEVKPFKIKVSCVLPGDTKTGFTAARVCEGENVAAKKSVEKMARDEQKGKSPKSVAKVIYKIAKRKNPPLRVSVGGVSKLEVFLSRLLSVKFLNFIIRKIYC